jgi:hypothetical protein
MRDLALYVAGGLAVVVAVVHGVLGETQVFARATIEPQRLQVLLRAVWQIGTVAWIAFGGLLIAAPSFGSDAARSWIVAAAVVTFAAGALGNAWAMGGQHFGWMLLALVCGLAIAGR